MGYMTAEDSLQYRGYDELMEYYRVQSKDLEQIMNDCFEITQSVLDDFNKIN